MKQNDIINRIKLLILQLKVIDLDRKSFIKQEGERGIEIRVDEILDEINDLNRKIKNENYEK